MTPDNPKCTVLISTFNRPDFLREAIESVVNQRFTDWELLIMNDGGVDVADVAASFNDPRIRYFPDDENRGAAYRFNFGLEQARGEYVTYLGDDDLFYPNHLEVLSQALDDHPSIAVAYSDLYAVSCVKDETTGKRHVLDKRLEVSRDFNRQFMFYYNHVLHVSMLHRREAAFRVGLYDDSVRVVIEWCLTRKFCFIYDFLHVPVPTGEYYMPVFKSDRISVVQRKNKESYRHNIRKIKSNFPPEPWPKVDRLSVIYPVSDWTEAVRDKVADMFSEFAYPFRLILVNNGTGKSVKACEEVLGNIAELPNVSILTPPTRLDEVGAYRYAAKNSGADYLFLATDRLQPKSVSQRLICGLEHLKTGLCDSARWDVDEERESDFDMLISRKLFLKKSHPQQSDTSIRLKTIKVFASGFMFDVQMSQVRRNFSQGKYQEAYDGIRSARRIKRGTPGMEFLINYYTRICLALGKYDQAEEELRALIARGYSPDNYIRLGQVLQGKKMPAAAVEAYKQGLAGFGLSDEDLEGPVFPFNFPKELASFNALIGLGECFFELGDRVEAAKHYHRAAKLRANSHKPFLGFAKIYLAANQLDRVELAMLKVRERDGKDPETHRVLGKLCQRRDRLDLAFGCYLKAFEFGKSDEKNIDPLYYAGAALGKWEEMRPPLEAFLEEKPEHVPALNRLAAVHFELGEAERALELLDRGLALDPNHPAFRGLRQKIERSHPGEVPAAIPAG